MRGLWHKLFAYFFILLGIVVTGSFFIFRIASADTVILKSGKDLKGLIVEEHTDRIILSTEKGEVPILRNGIKEIQYDEPAQNFMQIGRNYEASGRVGEALAYYEKALELNPDLKEAEKAIFGLRSRFWAVNTEGPREEIEKQQILFEAWEQKKPVEDVVEKKAKEQAKTIRTGLGIVLEKKEDWVRLAYVDPKSSAAIAGLKKNDRLVAMDHQSLRYLSENVVGKKMLAPRFSNFSLEFERDCYLHKGEKTKIHLKDLGLGLHLEYQGLVVNGVRSGSIAGQAGIKNRDLVIQIDGMATRYMPLKKAKQLIHDSEEERIILTIRRTALLSRP